MENRVVMEEILWMLLVGVLLVFTGISTCIHGVLKAILWGGNIMSNKVQNEREYVVWYNPDMDTIRIFFCERNAELRTQMKTERGMEVRLGKLSSKKLVIKGHEHVWK
jgi:hypothetical protein